MTGRGAMEGAGKKADPLAGNGREAASLAAGEGRHPELSCSLRA